MSRIFSNPLCISTYICTCISLQQSYPNKFQSSKSNQVTKHRPVSPSPSLRPKGLVQARRSRSGGFPSPRRGLERGTRSQRGISLRRDLSRLGEMFARSKIERVAQRPFAQKGDSRCWKEKGNREMSSPAEQQQNNEHSWRDTYVEYGNGFELCSIGKNVNSSRALYGREGRRHRSRFLKKSRSVNQGNTNDFYPMGRPLGPTVLGQPLK